MLGDMVARPLRSSRDMIPEGFCRSTRGSVYPTLELTMKLLCQQMSQEVTIHVAFVPEACSIHPGCGRGAVDMFYLEFQIIGREVDTETGRSVVAAHGHTNQDCSRGVANPKRDAIKLWQEGEWDEELVFTYTNPCYP
ncbi:hypothetical protein PG995_004742 [Apiospora arundinis]